MASTLLKMGKALHGMGSRNMTTASIEGYKVAVLGAAGGIGQPLSLLMKLNPFVKELSLYDIAGTPGVATDLSHCNTRAITKGYAGDEALGEALTGCDLVIIPAGMPRKPGMSRDDLFKVNASIVQALHLKMLTGEVQGLVKACGIHCPEAILNIISNPVNSTVPIAAETLKQMGVYQKTKVLGVTTLDVVRARTFYAEKTGKPKTVDVPVIGGHAGITILPLFSQATDIETAGLSEEDIKELTVRTQDGGTEVVQAKAGMGSATLSMAYAAGIFADACMRGISGKAFDGKEASSSPVECTYIETNVVEGLSFFATPCELGKHGVKKVLDIGRLSAYEQESLETLKAELKSSIDKGLEYAKQNPVKSHA